MEQIDIFRHAVEALERLEVPYLIVGSIAGMAYGESRFTQDIDIVVSLNLSHVTGFLRAFPQPEYYLSEPAIRDSIRNRFPFNVIHPSSGNKIDFMMPGTDEWSRSQLSRGRQVRLLPDRDVMAASPEDVILGKLWYYTEGGGDRHLRDIAGILRITSDVDRAEVTRWATQMGYLEAWNSVLAGVDAPDRPAGPGVP